MSHSFDISPARYRIKKIARRAAVAMGGLLRAVDPGDVQCIRVLTYHRFEGSPLDPCSVDANVFSEQLRWLNEHCEVSTPTAKRRSFEFIQHSFKIKNLIVQRHNGNCDLYL